MPRDSIKWAALSATRGKSGTADSVENGWKVAKLLEAVLAKESFALVLTSPLERARKTCELAGLGERAEIDSDLMEWNYGAYEGLTPKQIHAQAPGWMLFSDGCPGGESPEQVGARVDRVIARVRGCKGMPRCSRTATFSECLRPGGLAFRPRRDVTSCSIRRR